MKVFFFFLFSLTLFHCKNLEKTTFIEEYIADKNISQPEADSFKYSIIRYAGQVPPKANHQNRFNVEYDSFYENLAKEHDLVYYYSDKTEGSTYFLMTRIAPSLYEKRVAIGGKLKRDEKGAIIYYEEAFRTWKMKAPELEKKAAFLFSKYIKGKDLKPYYTKNSKGEEYIEFPDDNVYFDTISRVWTTKSK